VTRIDDTTTMEDTAMSAQLSTHASHDDGGWEAMRWLTRTQLAALASLFGIAVVVSLTITVLLVSRTGVELSLWAIVLQVARWWGVAIGAYTAYVYTPLFVVHGHTRRSIGRQLVGFLAIFTLALAALLALGFGLERVVHDLAGGDGAALHAELALFDHGWPFAVVRLWASVASWTVAAAVAGFGAYRGDLMGTGLFVVAVVLGLGGELVARTGSFDVLDQVLPFRPLLFVPLAVLLLGLLGRLGWALLRELPLKPR
jgi:hypothetical protein